MEYKEIIALSQSERATYPDIIPHTYGLDVDVSTYRAKVIPAWGHAKNNPKRMATLKISTFRGISCDAEHYYGEINFQGVIVDKGERSTFTIEMREKLNAFEKSVYPQLEYSHKLTLSRRVTQEDKDRDKEATCEADVKFNYYRVGDSTDRWNSVEELIEFFKKVCRVRFNGDWDFGYEKVWKPSRITINPYKNE